MPPRPMKRVKVRKSSRPVLPRLGRKLLRSGEKFKVEPFESSITEEVKDGIIRGTYFRQRKKIGTINPKQE